MTLPACHSRRLLTANGTTYFCAHPAVDVPDQRVTDSDCRGCPLWREEPPSQFRAFPPLELKRREQCLFLGDQTGTRPCKTCRGQVKMKVFDCHHPMHADTTLRACLRCPHFTMKLLPHSVRTWAVGVAATPAARGQRLGRCLDRLAAAGWPDVRLFVEPRIEIPPQYVHLPRTDRAAGLAQHAVWLMGLAELVERQPHADAYFMLFDDTLLCRNLRPLLEHILWPAERMLFVALDCRPRRQPEGTGLQPIRAVGGSGNLQTVVFPNATVRSYLATAASVDQGSAVRRGRRPSSVPSLARWAERCDLPIYAHFPPLGRRVVRRSRNRRAARRAEEGRAERFVGCRFDAMGLLAANPAIRGEQSVH